MNLKKIKSLTCLQRQVFLFLDLNFVKNPPLFFHHFLATFQFASSAFVRIKHSLAKDVFSPMKEGGACAKQKTEGQTFRGFFFTFQLLADGCRW